MKLPSLSKLLCKVGIHLWHTIELEQGWRMHCIFCGYKKSLQRPINFQMDIQPLLDKYGLQGHVMRQSTSFDDLLHIQDGKSYVNVALPTTPVTDGDVILNEIFAKASTIFKKNK